jgi:hypothetical protein
MYSLFTDCIQFDVFREYLKSVNFFSFNLLSNIRQVIIWIKFLNLKAFGIMICTFTNFGLRSNDKLLSNLLEIKPEIRTIKKCFIITGLLLMFNSILGLTAIIRKKLSFLIAVSLS